MKNKFTYPTDAGLGKMFKKIGLTILGIVLTAILTLLIFR